MSARIILLVEDEPTLQRILGSVLTDAGHAVESVGTAEAALTAARLALVDATRTVPCARVPWDRRRRSRGWGAPGWCAS